MVKFSAKIIAEKEQLPRQLVNLGDLGPCRTRVVYDIESNCLETIIYLQ